MAARSPSPNPSRSSCSHHSRTSENCSTLRKSFNGGGGACHLVAKPSTPQESLQKVAKPAARSPAGSTTKNFMAPTISAASKTVGASPKRRILTERNENEPVANICSQEFMVKKELKKPEAASIVCSPAAVISPLDADPSLPPYDPKTNYLSPRPKFLHYKPNPRVEHYLRGEEKAGEEDLDLFELGIGNGKQLEDGFSSESSEDTSTETRSPLQDTSEETSLNECSMDELTSSQENHVLREVEEEEKEEAEEEGEVLKECQELRIEEPKMNSRLVDKFPRRSHFPRSAVVLLLLTSVFACFYVQMSDSPIKYQSATKNSSPSLRYQEDFRDYLVEFAGTANVKFLEVTNRIRHWLNPMYFSYVTPVHHESDFSLICLANLTTSNLKLPFYSSPLLVELIKKEHEWEPDAEAGDSEEQTQTFSEHQSEGVSVINPVEEEEMVSLQTVVADEIENQAEYQEKECEVEGSLDEADSDSLDEKMEENDVTIKVKQEESQLDHDKPNVEISGEDFSDSIVRESDVNEDSSDPVDYSNNHLKLTSDNQMSESLQQLPPQKSLSKDEFPLQASILTSFIATVFVGTMAVLRSKKKSPSNVSSKSIQVKKAPASMCGSTEKPYSSYFIEDMDLDMNDDSGPSEMSSSLQTRSLGRGRVKRAIVEETSSIERKSRRDSTFSSSTSYGSFTTYERLPAKKGSVVDGEVTPVRRSSRIRQLTSP